jgi:hypothetical protein
VKKKNHKKKVLNHPHSGNGRFKCVSCLSVDLRAALHKESRPSKVGAVSTKILALMAPSSASSGHLNKSITGGKTLVCKGLGAKESRPLYKALKVLAHLPLSSLSFALLVTLKMDEHRHKITIFVNLRLSRVSI